VFDHRVELVDGEVWPVVVGSWHGDTQAQVAAMLRLPGTRVSTSTLVVPSDDSVPDPDCWVRRSGAERVGTRGARLDVWDPTDVLLVVEVSDDSVLADLNTKARLYGRAAYPVYWVVTREAIYEHTGPTAQGYRTRTDLSVSELLGPDERP
jgi:hypothetical protein